MPAISIDSDSGQVFSFSVVVPHTTTVSAPVIESEMGTFTEAQRPQCVFRFQEMESSTLRPRYLPLGCRFMSGIGILLQQGVATVTKKRKRTHVTEKAVDQVRRSFVLST
jgi:hypothetical protein